MRSDRRRLLIPLVLLAAAGWLLAGGCAGRRAGFRPPAPAPYASGPWSYGDRPARLLRSEHYQIYTTLADQRLLEHLPQMMEAAYAYYRHLVPTARPPAEPMKVYLFARRREWVAFTRRFTGARAGKFLQLRRGGYSLRGVTVIEYGGYPVTFPIMAHEGLHQYLHHCVPGPLPAWLNEGLAAYCEGQRWGANGLESFDPWLNPARRNALAEALIRDELFPLPQLLRIDAGQVVGGSNRRIATYYAQVWALMLFLQDGANGKYARRFARLLREVGAGRARSFAQAAYVWSADSEFNYGEALFRGLVTADLETFADEFDQFIRQRIIG